jgi:hypothetical protein
VGGLFQLRVGEQALARGVLPLEVLEPLGVVGLQPAELVAPAVVGLLGDRQLAADVGDVLALTEHAVRGRELAHDLLRAVPLPRCHVLVEPSCPQHGRQDSHSTWINQPGSGQRGRLGSTRALVNRYDVGVAGLEPVSSSL